MDSLIIGLLAAIFLVGALPSQAYTMRVPCYWVGGPYPYGYWQCNAYVPDLYIGQGGKIWYPYSYHEHGHDRDWRHQRR